MPITRFLPPYSRLAALVLSALMLAACSSSVRRAPVEDRTGAGRWPASGVEVKPLPGAENAGKPGYYTVRPGDTMIRIGLETGQNWRDIQRWNDLENPNVIEVGQVLRVAPPEAEVAVAAAPTVAAVRPVNSAKVEPRSLDAKPGVPASAPPAAASTSTASTSAAAAPPPAVVAPTVTTPAAREDDEPQWAWPASGSVVTPYDETRNKGVAIAGKAGDPVLAAADGRVVYAGSGLRGYGNLVIVKHNATYLTAYAHNQALLVKEDQQVKRGQKIAEMGSTDAERVQLHFEIRRLGKPVDPSRLLPPR